MLVLILVYWVGSDPYDMGHMIWAISYEPYDKMVPYGPNDMDNWYF